MKAYPEYKESNVEWLGRIPTDWTVKPIKWLCTVKRGQSPRPIDDPIYFDENGEYAWVRISNVTASNKYLYETDQKLSEIGASKCVKLEPGELFVSIAATVGKPIINKIKCCIHDGFVWLQGLEQSKEFFYYMLSGGELYKGLGKLGTQLNLNSEYIGNIYVPVPSIEEQAWIVDFLDCKTSQIDALIEKKQRQIDLLQEQRTALINHAVTKGLNPDALMKNSGVEWYGEIPQHWDLKRLGWITSVIMDIDHKMPLAVEDGIPFLSAKDLLNDGTLNFDRDVKKISEEDFQALSRKVQPRRNDIIYSRIGARLGKARLVQTDQRFLVSYSCCVVRVIEEMAFPEYICFIMDSEILLTEAKARTVGIGVPDLGLGEIAKFPIPLPPKSEQAAILEFLKKKDAKIKSGIKDISSQIALLEEYRTALISEAVTGKIDVREWRKAIHE